LLKGDLAFQQSRYQEALNAYSKAYQLNPRSTEARRKLAIVLTLLGRPEEARKYQ
jgi:Flp pilus assembly protein TadD